jgi:hypothetical protein
MKETENRQMVADLIDMVWQMEQLLKDYGRHLTAHDEGHQLESEMID